VSRDPTWAATSVPEIRNRWCNALDATADRQTEIIESPPQGGAGSIDPSESVFSQPRWQSISRRSTLLDVVNHQFD